MFEKPAEGQVAFYFDPVCPWTWKTSRWLVEISNSKEIEIMWRPFSLYFLNEGAIPEEYADALNVSLFALRVIAKLCEDARYEDIGRFYRALGEAWFEGEEQVSLDVVERCLSEVGLDGCRVHLKDESIDDLLRAMHSYAHKLAGDGTGSPVLEIADQRAIYGPILTETLSGQEALDVFDAVSTLVRTPSFSEMKRHR
ncbi:hypothetical protein [Ferrithrix thermotolerans]|nr:hypothetical protein [Ferrithrix thermotolerans]